MPRAADTYKSQLALQEVLQGQIQKKSVRNNREYESLNKEVEFQELEIQLAEKQIKTKQYHGALDILDKIRKRQKSNSTLYKVASDSLIGLERFGKAEILALCAYINGDKSIANFLNLASLSAMRKDQLMASHWLNEAKKIDENNKHFLQSKELLFPQGSAREDDLPFSG